MAPRLKGKTFGGCGIHKMTPEISEGINITLTLEQTLMLGLAIDECARQVNGLNRAMAAGRDAGVRLIIWPTKRRIAVMAGRAAQESSPYGRRQGPRPARR